MIAIVDDDESVRAATASLMKAAGFAYRTYPCARDFLASDAVAGTKFLIADVQMPGMSGLELFEQLRRAGSHIPTVLITAYPDERQRHRALSDGVAGYLSKPFSASELLDFIQARLEPGEERSSRS
jgi:FixJ family two-component response regulator